jgi:antitoxin FitA
MKRCRFLAMEAEIRAILTDAVAEPVEEGLVHALMHRFAELGGVDLDISPRREPARAANFSE